MAPISIQHAKESNFAQFARLIDSMENRYMNVGSDGIVDINSLQVIRTRSGRVSKPRVSITPNRPIDKKRKGRSSLYSNTSSSTPLTNSSSASLPVSSSSTPLPASSSQDSSSFDQTQSQPQRAITSNHNRSILFDRPAQNAASKSLLAILKAGGPLAAKTARNIYERALIVLGRDDLPNKAKMRPFFTFHEEQDVGVTFLFDTPDYTPWTLICLKFFGEENLDLYKQIYNYVLAEAAMRSRQSDFSMRTITSNVRTPASAKTDYLALMPCPQNDPKRMEVDEDDLENLNTQQTPHRTRSSNQVVSAKASPSVLSKAYVTASSSMPIYHPSIESIVYQNDAQLASLRKLAEILRQNDEESRQVKRKLTARAAKALGIESMPYGRNVLPFFTFHEKEIGVSFLFNIETLSPWANICQLYFGDEILELNKEIYRMMNQPRSESLLMLEKLCKL